MFIFFYFFREECSWEPRENLDCADLIKDFDKRHPTESKQVKNSPLIENKKSNKSSPVNCGNDNKRHKETSKSSTDKSITGNDGKNNKNESKKFDKRQSADGKRLLEGKLSVDNKKNNENKQLTPKQTSQVAKQTPQVAKQTSQVAKQTSQVAKHSPQVAKHSPQVAKQTSQVAKQTVLSKQPGTTNKTALTKASTVNKEPIPATKDFSQVIKPTLVTKQPVTKKVIDNKTSDISNKIIVNKITNESSSTVTAKICEINKTNALLVKPIETSNSTKVNIDSDKDPLVNSTNNQSLIKSDISTDNSTNSPMKKRKSEGVMIGSPMKKIRDTYSDINAIKRLEAQQLAYECIEDSFKVYTI